MTQHPHDHGHHGHSHASHAARPDTHRDPVCGMTVPATSPHRVQHDGEDVFFCSARCREKFVADPARYLAVAAPSAPMASGAVEYTCPMHPEIVRDGPGSCPICGMALEPRTITADAGPDPELRSMTVRFWIAAVLSL